MTVVYMLCGPSLAGKSTAAAALAAKTGAAIINADAINAERGLPFGGEGLSESVWAETLRIQIERLHQSCRAGRDVIIDDTLCYRWLRDRFRKEAAAAGASHVLLVFRREEEEILRRREAVKDRPVLSRERLRDHLDRFEWPGPDESPVGPSGLLDE